jgi:hypothetical protein
MVTLNWIAQEIDRELPKSPYFYFFISSDNSKVWSRIKTGTIIRNKAYILNSAESPQKGTDLVCITTKRLEEFTATDRDYVNELLSWLDQHFKTILLILKPLL